MSACTYVTQKWPRQGASGFVIVRYSAGRAGDERVMHLSGRQLVQAIHHELIEAHRTAIVI